MASERILSKEEIETALNERHSPEKQKLLSAGQVTIAGLGGLGSNVAYSLARIGVGHLHLIDFDVVDITNLNRQQYFMEHIGMYKTDALKSLLLKINPYLDIRTDCVKVTEANLKELFEDAQIVCEAFDNPEAKAMLVNGILEYFPEAQIEAVDFEEGKAGPVMTCLAGLKNINDDQPILFNDCDHMFACDRFAEDMNSENWNYDGALLTFESNEPQFSYVQYENGRIVGTVEKKVVSNHAICGAYMVRNAQMFREMADEYLQNCNYSEFFVSGIYNVMCKKGLEVRNYTTDFHVPFGTPIEYEQAQNSEYFEVLK